MGIDYKSIAFASTISLHQAQAFFFRMTSKLFNLNDT